MGDMMSIATLIGAITGAITTLTGLVISAFQYRKKEHFKRSCQRSKANATEFYKFNNKF